MKNGLKLVSRLSALAIIACSSNLFAATVYFDEISYLEAIKLLGKQTQTESFEDAAVWSPRDTALTSVTSRGITWSSNSDGLPISTFDTRAFSGSYHLTQPTNLATAAFLKSLENLACESAGNCGDGFIGQSAATLYGVGGYILGATGATVGLFLDGSPTNILGGDQPVADIWTFVGVIEEAGFNSFEFREMEFLFQSTAEGNEWFQIRSDQFAFAVDTAVVPLPAALWLFAFGLMGLGGLARGSRHKESGM